MPSTRKRLHLSALLISLALIVACGGGGSGGDTDTTCDGTDCIDSNVPMTSATMTIDGEIDDWENIPPIVIDGAGDNYPRTNFSGTDLEAFYLAIDRTYLYGLFTLHDGPPREDGTIYFFVANQEEGVHYSDGDFSITAGYMDSVWRLWAGNNNENGHPTCTRGSYSDDYIAAGAAAIEWRVPLVALGDIHESTVRVYIHNPEPGVPVSDENYSGFHIQLPSSIEEPIEVVEGDWEGTTAEGHTVRFTVAGDELVDLSMSFGATTVTDVNPVPIDACSSFSSSMVSVQGTFQRSDYCSGNWGLFNSTWDAEPLGDP